MNEGRGRTYRAAGPIEGRREWSEPRLGSWAHRWGAHPPPANAQWSMLDEPDGWEGGEWADHAPATSPRPASSLTARSLRGVGPRGYRRSDARIREDACDLLMAQAEVDVTDVEVGVEDGELTLEGTVTDRMGKRRVEDFCEAVPGVVDVHNRLRIKR